MITGRTTEGRHCDALSAAATAVVLVPGHTYVASGHCFRRISASTESLCVHPRLSTMMAQIRNMFGRRGGRR